MTDEERDELLIRMDQSLKDSVAAKEKRDEVVDARLNAHALDIRALREWRNYLAGIQAAVLAYLGVGQK